MDTVLLFMGNHRRIQLIEIWPERSRWQLYTIWVDRNNCVIRFWNVPVRLRVPSELQWMNIPNAKLLIVKGNHFIANKRYITFNKEVEDFLQTLQ